MAHYPNRRHCRLQQRPLPTWVRQMNDTPNSPPPEPFSEELTIRALLAEYDWLGADQRQYNQFHRQDAQIFIAALGSFLGLLLANQHVVDKHLLYVIIPSFIFLYALSQLINLHVMFTQAKRRAAIETEINQRAKLPLMRWESQIAPNYLHPVSNPAILAIIGPAATLLVGFAVFGTKSVQFYGWKVGLIIGTEIIFLGLVLVRFFQFQRRVAPSPCSFGNLSAGTVEASATSSAAVATTRHG